jgi:hypothetical protein
MTEVEMSETQRENLIAASCLLFGTEGGSVLKGFVRQSIGGSNADPVYWVIGDVQWARLGSSAFTEFRRASRAFSDATGEIPTRLGAQTWDACRRSLLAAAVVKVLPPEASPTAGVAATMLREVVSGWPPVEEKDSGAYRSALEIGRPVRRTDGTTWYSIEAVLRYAALPGGVKITREDLIQGLDALGCGDREVIDYTRPGEQVRHSRRAYYRLAQEFVEEFGF